MGELVSEIDPLIDATWDASYVLVFESHIFCLLIPVLPVLIDCFTCGTEIQADMRIVDERAGEFCLML